MIRYTLCCADGHTFDSWFQSGNGYESLRGAGMVTCPVCGTSSVDKALMAPAVQPARRTGQSAPALTDAVTSTPAPAVPAPLAPRVPQAELEMRLAALRNHIETHSDYVGLDFVTEARRMHQGEVPERAIHGEAKPDEARALIEDGVPIAPLPFPAARKMN